MRFAAPDNIGSMAIELLSHGARVGVECGQALNLGLRKNLDWFYVAIPRLCRYLTGVREPRDMLIRFSLYQRM
jgi:hypothetical protein